MESICITELSVTLALPRIILITKVRDTFIFSQHLKQKVRAGTVFKGFRLAHECCLAWPQIDLP